MSVKSFFIIGAAVSLGYGIAFLLAPQVVLAAYGAKSDAAVVLGYRYFSVALLTTGVMCWALRECRDQSVLQPVLIGLAIADVAGVAVSVSGTLSGTINALGWLNALLYVALAAGSIYCYFGLTQPTRLTA